MTDFTPIFLLFSLILCLLSLVFIPLIFFKNKKEETVNREIYRLNYSIERDTDFTRYLFIYPVTPLHFNLPVSAENIEDLFVITNILKKKLAHTNYIGSIELEIYPLGIKISRSPEYFETMSIIKKDVKEVLENIILNKKYVCLNT